MLRQAHDALPQAASRPVTTPLDTMVDQADAIANPLLDAWLPHQATEIPAGHPIAVAPTYPTPIVTAQATEVISAATHPTVAHPKAAMVMIALATTSTKPPVSQAMVESQATVASRAPAVDFSDVALFIMPPIEHSERNRAGTSMAEWTVADRGLFVLMK